MSSTLNTVAYLRPYFIPRLRGNKKAGVTTGYSGVSELNFILSTAHTTLVKIVSKPGVNAGIVISEMLD